MVDGIEGFAEVSCSHNGAGRRFLLVKTPSYLVGERVESGDGRVAWGEAVLVGGAGEMGKNEGAHKTLKDFGGRTKEGNRSIRDTKLGGFIGFENGKDDGRFPDSGKGRVGSREVEEKS